MEIYRRLKKSWPFRIDMFSTLVTPRFNDTDALGHINNAAVVMWFETARRPVFKLFTPDLDPKNWKLIVVRIEIDYKEQLIFQEDVEVKTFVHRLGNSSFRLIQQAWQGEKLRAEGKCILVHMDYPAQKSRPIPDSIRSELQKHLQD